MPKSIRSGVDSLSQDKKTPYDALLVLALISFVVVKYGSQREMHASWGCLAMFFLWSAMVMRPGPWRGLATCLGAVLAPFPSEVDGVMIRTILPLCLWRVVVQWPTLRLRTRNGSILTAAVLWPYIGAPLALAGNLWCVDVVTMVFLSVAASMWFLNSVARKTTGIRLLAISCAISPVSCFLSPVSFTSAFFVFLPAVVLVLIGLSKSFDSSMVEPATITVIVVVGSAIL